MGGSLKADSPVSIAYAVVSKRLSQISWKVRTTRGYPLASICALGYICTHILSHTHKHKYDHIHIKRNGFMNKPKVSSHPCFECLEEKTLWLDGGEGLNGFAPSKKMEGNLPQTAHSYPLWPGGLLAYLDRATELSLEIPVCMLLVRACETPTSSVTGW